jgi:hypothetical protein
MSAKLIAEVEEQRHSVVVDTYTPTWNELLDQYTRGDLVIDPNYQRAFRWTSDQQTKYIESLLLNIPTPPLFLAEKRDGTFEVMDGLQRFSTMIRFFANASKASESRSNVRMTASHENDLTLPTTLTAGPILPGLFGMTRLKMPEALTRTLRYSRIQVILLKKESSELAKYYVFTRLNRAGSLLSNQEIRNCSARITNPQFADAIMRLGATESVLTALKLSPGEAKAMGNQENILRLIAFCYQTPTTQRIEDFLDDAMYQAASGRFLFDKKKEQKIIATFDVVSQAYPNGEAFRFYKDGKFSGAFSSNLFDIVACGVFLNLTRVKKNGLMQLRKRIVELHLQPEVKALTGAGSNTRAKMIGRPAFGRKWFA